MRKFGLIFLGLFSFVSSGYAGVSLGEMANNVLGPMNGLGKLLGYVCILGGIGMLFGAILQYKAHRENPSQVRLTTPVFLVVVGIVLLILPFIGVISGYKEALIHI